MSYFTKFSNGSSKPVKRVRIRDMEMKENVGDFLEYNNVLYPIMNEDTLSELQQIAGLGHRVEMSQFCPEVDENEGLESGEMLFSAGWVPAYGLNTKFKKVNEIQTDMSRSRAEILLKSWAEELDMKKLYTKTYVDIEKYLCHMAMSIILQGGNAEELAAYIEKCRSVWLNTLERDNPSDILSSDIE